MIQILLIFLSFGALILAALAVMEHATIEYAVMLLALVVFIDRLRKEEWDR